MPKPSQMRPSVIALLPCAARGSLDATRTAGLGPPTWVREWTAHPNRQCPNLPRAYFRANSVIEAGPSFSLLARVRPESFEIVLSSWCHGSYVELRSDILAERHSSMEGCILLAFTPHAWNRTFMLALVSSIYQGGIPIMQAQDGVLTRLAKSALEKAKILDAYVAEKAVGSGKGGSDNPVSFEHGLGALRSAK